MYLDYSKLEFDKYGRPEVPNLVLKTLSEDTLGVLSGVHNLKMNIKFSEPSEISFDIPSVIDGMPNPLYLSVTGRKIIYTKSYGVYVTMNPSTTDDGISSVKSVKGYSIEKRLEDKRFFLEEGTFNFWNPVTPDDTILGRIREIAPDWSIGYVSPSLIGRYRTFDSYDDYLLSFVYNAAPEKFRCVFVFDPYQKTMNVYDADEERPILPIYLDFENLLQSVQVEELSDELVTALRPYGADELDIRDVNPIGSPWLYDLSYFISNGDLPSELVEKWKTWQALVLSKQEYYKGLVCLRASTTARILKAEAELTDLKGELTDLTNQQSVTIQAIAMESTSNGKEAQQKLLSEINEKISAKNGEISVKEAEVAAIKAEEKSYAEQIQSVVSELSIKEYFGDDYLVLNQYFVEQDITEDSFVATDINTAISGQNYSIDSGSICIGGVVYDESSGGWANYYDSSATGTSVGSSITRVDIDMTDGSKKHMYVISGGSFKLSGDADLGCDIIRGTLEIDSADNGYVLSLYASKITSGDKTAASGTITLTGTASNITTDIAAVTEDEITTYEGTMVEFDISDASMYLTANVSDYQKYSVKLDLFEYATDLLSDLATPTYEFSVDSGNFLFSKEFMPFRNKLVLGNGVYLNIRGIQTITPLIIEFELDFENRDKFSLVFSNRFKRHDGVNTLKDMLEKSYSSSRSFDASKYIYNKSANRMSSVAEFMNSSLDAAKNAIIAATNQNVVIDGAGIHVGGDDDNLLRITNGMIAISNDNWATAKLAIGNFSSPKTGEYFGINTELLGGVITITENLIVENEQVDENGNQTGVMQFKVDSTGAWLYNSTYVLQSDTVTDESGNVVGSGGIIIDPRWGIVAGTGDLFKTNGTTVTPSFVDEDGNVTLDEDGIPTNANFYLNVSDGNAYFRGTVNATTGSIGGWTIGEDKLYHGSGNSYVALGGSGSDYAVWAGGDTPDAAKFYVTKSGGLYADKGTFKGTVEAGTYKDRNGNSMMTDDEYKFKAEYLNLKGLNVNDKFIVNSDGTVTINGGSINWGGVSEIGSSAAQQTADSALSVASTARLIANDASDDAYTAIANVEALGSGRYRGTFINGNSIYSPLIYAGKFYAVENNNSDFMELDSDSLTFYQNSIEKMSIGYGNDDRNYVRIDLGNTGSGSIVKRNGTLWIGTWDESTCGILFDFNAGTYTFYGRQA